MVQLDAFDVLTPLGPAKCFAVCDEGEVVEWVTAIKATGEVWFWRTPFIRFAWDITSGGGKPSPFFDVPEKLQPHIDRYRQQGWLKN